jgi:transposase
MAVSLVTRGVAIAGPNGGHAMEDTLIECCGGLDVHQGSIMACVLSGPANSKPRKELRRFATMPADLVQLRQWLRAAGCTAVAMESSGVYWIPVYAALEGHFELVVANPQRIKQIPGRKTDVKDCEWLARLLRQGMMPKSFVPPKPIRQLREMLRFRRKLVERAASQRNRVIKVLEVAGIKLASIVSDVFGVSGHAMLRALAQGTASPAEMAALAKGVLRRRVADLEQALSVPLEEHQRMMLTVSLDSLDHDQVQLAQVEGEIDRHLQPYRAQQLLLMRIPGIDRIIAATIIAEIDVAHLVSWAGICPGNNQSADKRFSTRIGHGNPFLKTALVQAAVAASRKQGSYLKDKFFRLKARRGFRRAAVAMARKILVIVYHMLKFGRPYQDLGDTYLDHLSHSRTKRNLLRRLERLGYKVTLQPNPA